MKKFISILIVLALCVSLCAVASAEEDWTIFVYLCGADLESENSMATGNMQQMIDANTGPNVRFVVETGGASSWHNGANPDKLDRFLITGGSSTLVDSQPSAPGRLSGEPHGSGPVGPRQRQYQRRLL